MKNNKELAKTKRGWCPNCHRVVRVVEKHKEKDGVKIIDYYCADCQIGLGRERVAE